MEEKSLAQHLHRGSLLGKGTVWRSRFQRTEGASSPSWLRVFVCTARFELSAALQIRQLWS